MSTIYLDTSAMLKRVLVEPQSMAVVAQVADYQDRGDLMVASSLAWVEACRALRRTGTADVDAVVADATSGIAEFPLSPTVLVQARSLGPESLRTLDALHLSAAVTLAVDAIMTFDDRLAAAAEAVGLRVVAPA